MVIVMVYWSIVELCDGVFFGMMIVVFVLVIMVLVEVFVLVLSVISDKLLY